MCTFLLIVLPCVALKGMFDFFMRLAGYKRQPAAGEESEDSEDDQNQP